MTTQFYRKVAVCAILSYSVLLVGQNKPKARTGPRALSVLEKDPNGGLRLVPVTIWINDRYYDASQYQANPVPMAAEPGTVYEVLESNVPVGWFTAQQPQQVRGSWMSGGTWQDKKNEDAEKKPAKVEVEVGKDDDRPTLKRHKDADSGTTSDDKTTADTKPKKDDSDPDPPTLKKPKTSDSADEDKNSTPTVAKRSAAPVDGDLSRDTNRDDPDRPTLRKTRAGVNPTDADKPLSIPQGVTQTAAPAKVAVQPGATAMKQYIAISDAEKTDYRPFTYELKAEDKAQYAAKLQKIAAPILQKWAEAHGGNKLPAGITFADFDLRAYDVDYSNNPELIFTASYTPVAATTAKKRVAGKIVAGPPASGPATPITYYLTLVARADSNNDVNPLFSEITDSTRLDAYPRLELIDAVDADGYGRGSLLFREYNDVGKAYVLYRVDAYNLTKLFEGASGE